MTSRQPINPPDDTSDRAKATALDEALMRGVTDAEAGRVMPVEMAFRRLREELGLGCTSVRT